MLVGNIATEDRKRRKNKTLSLFKIIKAQIIIDHFSFFLQLVFFFVVTEIAAAIMEGIKDILTNLLCKGDYKL